jgi:hypothetical protein
MRSTSLMTSRKKKLIKVLVVNEKKNCKKRERAILLDSAILYLIHVVMSN